MDEAQHLADRIAVIDKGRIVAEGTPETLGGRSDGAARISFGVPEGVDISAISSYLTTTGDGGYELLTESPTEDLHRLTSWALNAGIELETLVVDRPSLEDVYLELTGDE